VGVELDFIVFFPFFFFALFLCFIVLEVGVLEAVGLAANAATDTTTRNNTATIDAINFFIVFLLSNDERQGGRP
jgi:hypothetical protein